MMPHPPQHHGSVLLQMGLCLRDVGEGHGDEQQQRHAQPALLHAETPKKWCWRTMLLFLDDIAIAPRTFSVITVEHVQTYL